MHKLYLLKEHWVVAVFEPEGMLCAVWYTVLAFGNGISLKLITRLPNLELSGQMPLVILLGIMPPSSAVGYSEIKGSEEHLKAAEVHNTLYKHISFLLPFVNVLREVYNPFCI